MNDFQKKLFTENDTLFLTEEINHETYGYILEALLQKPDQRLKLYCAGAGGDSPAALSIVDLLQQHGKVVGFLPGYANSCHSTIFCGCAQRYAFPGSRIGIHRVAWTNFESRIDGQNLPILAMDFNDTDQRNAAIYASASDRGYDFWMTMLRGTGSSGVTFFDYLSMLEMGMARSIKEFNSEGI